MTLINNFLPIYNLKTILDIFCYNLKTIFEFLTYFALISRLFLTFSAIISRAFLTFFAIISRAFFTFSANIISKLFLIFSVNMKNNTTYTAYMYACVCVCSEDLYSNRCFWCSQTSTDSNREHTISDQILWLSILNYLNYFGWSIKYQTNLLLFLGVIFL